MTAHLYWLDRIQPEHRLAVGNKAFHLSNLLQQGYPIVPGFVVAAASLREFLEHLDWSEPLFADLPHSSLHFDIENPQQLQTIAQQLRRVIGSASLSEALGLELQAAIAQLQSPCLILRPSLSLQAGGHNAEVDQTVVTSKSSALFNSQICRATATDVAIALKSLWAQLFSAKSLFYWQRQEIPLNQIHLAVLMQPIHAAIAAGTVLMHHGKFEIQATAGLGMAIARGEVLPDVYRGDPSGAIQTQLGNQTIAYTLVNDSPTPLQVDLLRDATRQQPALQADDRQRLTDLVHRLATNLGNTFEVEWVLDQHDGLAEFYLTQFTPGAATIVPSTFRSDMIVPEPEPIAASLSSEEASTTATVRVVTGLAVAPGQAIAKATVLSSLDALEAASVAGTVLIAATIPPAWLPLIQQAAAIVAEQGGMTSHSAIVARELGIPAVMAAATVTQQIQTGDLVMVDGDRGRVYRLMSSGEWQFDHKQPLSLASQSASSQESLTNHDRPPIGTKLMVNLSQLESLKRIVNLPVDGVGLLRSELLAISLLQAHPHQWLQTGRQQELVSKFAQAIQQFAAALQPRPVFYRSLDLRSHEFQDLPGTASAPELNPILGLRGTLSYVHSPALFDLELQALRQVQRSGHRNIHLLLPFVRTVEEFRFCRQRVEQAGLMLDAQFQLWIMAEVPSVLFLIPEFVKAGVQGISIGTNDLTQLLLGVDREGTIAPNSIVPDAIALNLDDSHPAVQAAIVHLIQQAQQAGIPCSICGQAPGRNPALVENLVRRGITSISVDPEAVEQTYWAIARAERLLLLESAQASWQNDKEIL
jgi:pyruvate,water dikinase